MRADSLADEQRLVGALHARVDELRARATAELDAVRRGPTAGTPGAQTEREAFEARLVERLAVLAGVSEQLCFGRLDMDDGGVRHVGRIGLSDDAQRQLLLDWRAPAAEPFYSATARRRRGVVRRRHLQTRRREVVGVHDDWLDVDAAPAGTEPGGDAALLAAVGAARTGRMHNIVATVQAEQDEAIRAPMPGVLVVQGGPGTGKTAVALHRAAYLLYTHRDRLSRSGVMLVGPGTGFLRYVEQVLPSLGETGVLLATPGELLPGVDARGAEPDEVAALKGDLRMADAVAAAVRERQRVPPRALRLDVDGTTVPLTPDVVARARAAARRSRKPHNVAREGFVRDVLSSLVRAYARALRVETDAERRGELEAGLRGARDVRREVNLLWMPLTPRRLVGDLLADPDRLARAAPWLTPAQRRLLHRQRGAAWTPADVPLLDEAAELLGEVDDESVRAEARARAERAQDLAYAHAVLDQTGTGATLSAELLADRYGPTTSRLSVAERAATDRTWAVGHVVVDEAQELSPMQWRLLVRRCPSRSMTVVGDVAQTSSAAGARSWAEVLEPHAPGRWRVAELTVGYRTPREVMDLAASVLRAAGQQPGVPRSVRAADEPPRRTATTPDGLPRAVADAVARERDAVGEGTVGVVTAPGLAPAVRDGLVTALSEEVGDALGVGQEGASSPVALLSAREAKGLEFDAVVVVEPTEVLGAGPRGANDLFVALTRPTRRLHLVHARPLPPALAQVAPAPRPQAA